MLALFMSLLFMSKNQTIVYVIQGYVARLKIFGRLLVSGILNKPTALHKVYFWR